MRYMLLIYSNRSAWETMNAEEQGGLMGEYMSFTHSIVESGEFLAGDPLQGVDAATTVRVRSGKSTTTAGPFAETAEVLAGYYIVEAADLDRATAIAASIPDARFGSVEVRPIRDMGPPA